MGLLGSSLYSPELATDNPVTITPVIDVADGNIQSVSETPPHDDFVTNPFKGEESKTLVSRWKHTEAYDVSWPVVRGAVEYRVYGSMSPANRRNLLAEGLDDVEFRFYPPYFSESVSYFFWVSWINDRGVETYLSDDPASLMASREKAAFNPNPITSDPNLFPDAEGMNQEMAKTLEYIRKCNRWELENDGEPALLYLRRHGEDRPWGVACSCTDRRVVDDSDPDYNGKNRCKFCFGTGVMGGFYPAIPVAIRYGNAPEQDFKYTKRGFELNHAFNTYMLWTPTVRMDDMLVRLVNGSRYVVTKCQPDISARGVRLHQEFDLTQVEKQDILMEVTDASIQRAIDAQKMPSYLRDGFKIFG